jgi:cysteine desulfurase
VNSERIYLDNAATTPLRAEVADAMREAAGDADYNPSSLHAEGRRARALLDSARERIAALLGATRNEVIFTGGGTESDNQAVIGTAKLFPRGAHIVTTAIEHHAVLAPIAQLHAEGLKATVLPVASDGRLEPSDFAAALGSQTAFASVMFANNEVGTVQPIAELAAIARDCGVLFHTDAIQVPSWLPVDVRQLGVDLLSLSAHKFGGPKGVGLLYARKGVPIGPIVYGGGQEAGRRSGTPNLLAIVGMARALELACSERELESRRVQALRDRLEAGIRSAVPDVRVNGAPDSRLANNLSVSFAGLDSSALLIALDLAGVAVSAGSACTSGSLEPSHVLQALGVEPRWQSGTIRFSLGTASLAGEIDGVLRILPAIVAGLRRPAGTARGDG